MNRSRPGRTPTGSGGRSVDAAGDNPGVKTLKDLKARLNGKASGKAGQKKAKEPWYSFKNIVRNLVIFILSIVLFRIEYNFFFKSTTQCLAHGNQVIEDKVWFEVACSDDYNEEEFFECKPKRCGRVVRDDLVSVEDAEHLLRLAKRGLAHGGSKGGASILDLHSGALSYGESFVNIYKLAENHKDLFTEEDFRIYTKVKTQIHRAIAEEFSVSEDQLFLTKPTFFSRMDTTPAKTVHDEYWHRHVDKETYGSFHYTSLLYLTTYKQDFWGGRFVFMDDKFNRTVEPKIGRVSFFTSGSENPHFVERVSEGVRYAITVSFTCDPEQAIDDPKLPT